MQKFNPNWTTPSVRHHLVPNTYLKGWATNGTSVVYIEKEEKNIDFTSKDYGRNTENLGRIKHFYSRRAGALFRNKEDCDKYFEPIKKYSYTVKIEGKVVKDTIVLNDNFYAFNERWDIYDKNNILISKKRKDSLRKEILAIHNSSLEKGWSVLLEDGWPTVRQQISSAVNKETKKDIIPAVKRRELINFMVSMDWRTMPAPDSLLTEYDKLVQMMGIQDFLENRIDEEDKMYPFINTYSEEQLHNYLLMQYDNFFKNAGPIFNQADYMYNNMVIELLISPNGYEFITSDKPVCMYTNKQGDTEYIFPIAPNLACAVRRGGSFKDIVNYYALTRLDKDQLYEYNEAIKNNCNKGYILSQKTLKPYFK